MRDAVDRVIIDRARLDQGFGNGFWMSLSAHVLAVGGVVGAQLVMPRPPPIQVAEGFVEVLPRGGGGTPNAPPPAPASPAQETPSAAEPAPEPEPPPKVIKPPQEQPRESRGLPEPEAKPSRRSRPTPTPRAATGLPGGTGTGTQTPGVEFAPAGAGIPGGLDQHGDWYLAGVQRKIWMIWTQQMRPDFRVAVRVQFTIHADGRVSDVKVVAGSGAALLDLAAQRAVMSAAPFGAFPPTYGGVPQITIQANFTPTR